MVDRTLSVQPFTPMMSTTNQKQKEKKRKEMNLEEKSTMKVSDISLYFLASTNLKEEVAFF